MALSVCPARAEFLKKLQSDPNGAAPATEEKVEADLVKWLAGLKKVVNTMEAFYEQGKYGKIL